MAEVQTEQVEQRTSYSHKEALEITKMKLLDILKDPLLLDIPTDHISPSELQARIDLERGKAFVVLLKRDSEEGEQTISIAIYRNTSVY